MSLTRGIKLSTRNLAFAFDMGNDLKSFSGAPTTNIVPDPDRNANFTTSNYWYSYNTNQYNGNSYFTIPSISSVSSNIVTTSSAHPFRTFDVCRAETTGGGVTAGVNYFIKKVSDTQFSLHAYNGTENGSQGYLVNDSYHKVHESIALDQRVSINATSFPTSWWGPPHLPNSACVKEIVPGGGRRAGSDSMRLHITRSAGVADGMAYGVYCPVTTGDTVRVSFWHKLTRGTQTSNANWQTYFGSGFSAPSVGYAVSSEWQRFEYTWTASNTIGFYQYWFPGSNGIGAWAHDICDLHITKNESTFAGFYPGTRTTQGVIKDWSNNPSVGTITASNLVYNDATSFSFDGTDSEIATGYTPGTGVAAAGCTKECWYKGTKTARNHLWSWGQSSSNNLDMNFNDGTYALWMYWDGGGSNAIRFTDASFGDNFFTDSQVHHIVFTHSGSTNTVYFDGVALTPSDTIGTQTFSSTNGTTGQLTISESPRFAGDVYTTRVYERALSAAEVAQNFKSQRTKYGV